MASISFEYSEDKLILCYTPVMGLDDITKRLDTEDGVSVKHTFWVTKDLLCEDIEDDDDWEETLRFYIGAVGEAYTQLDSEVFSTDHCFYFGNEISLKPEMFTAYRNISILRKIDEVIERDFYIGGDWEIHNGISKETFDELLAKFPKTAELDKYAHKRIASIIKDYFPECDKYKAIYEKFVESKNSRYTSSVPAISKYNVQIELEQFTVAYQELMDMLNRYEAIDEKQWQEKIQNILQLLYPKYICCAREIKFYGGKKDKQPDFLLVDANGFVDILEIKKADVRMLTQYRNNYVVTREISGAIQQIEKYVFCLNSSDKAKECVSKKLTKFLPERVEVKILNPQGILLAGRSNEFTDEQQKDFELIKRQYKHVADIMTYDDLVQRLENIIVSLKKRV
jgi:hypothetical protein